MKTIRYWAATPVYLLGMLLVLLGDAIDGGARDE